MCGSVARARVSNTRTVHRFTETLNCSNYLFLRNSRRKTVTHFSWNCSNRLFTWRVGRNR
ncbi:MAG: hypothetical protein E5V92_12365 [Mesorhizobium sp.]|nr:hypothetical protein EJ067_26020 [Mesorhizobium sp. M1D.F.Ca.ET.043.01.1.1]RWA97008.1 MAG: hypothetical protein EOQ32_04810 [Mesorhizobium sp.]RWE15728.1 MAG: hypothetical protein EOS61_08800 [Mesorhizobium sp.]TJW86816.1 MAG: hypothetical protein E5V92_12365 [Mesorhizobium sp.]